MKEEKKDNWFLSEGFSVFLIILGSVAVGVGLFMFLHKSNFFDWGVPIQNDKVGQLGDFVGGVAGSIWALASVILFYRALQIQDKSYQKQSAELDLQRKELESARILNVLYHQISQINQNTEKFTFNKKTGRVGILELTQILSSNFKPENASTIKHTIDYVIEHYYSLEGILSNILKTKSIIKNLCTGGKAEENKQNEEFYNKLLLLSLGDELNLFYEQIRKYDEIYTSGFIHYLADSKSKISDLIKKLTLIYGCK